MIDVFGYPLAALKFFISNFVILCLIAGVLLLSINTYNMDADKNKRENNQLYINLNISSLVLFGIFVFMYFITPYLDKKMF